MALISSTSSHSGLNKKVMTLPRIEHPSTLIKEDDRQSLDIRGRSRDGQGSGQLIRSELSTPNSTYRRRRSSSFKHYSHSMDYPATQIPENTNVVYGSDRDKVRLPIFGHRPESTRSSHGVESGRSSPTTTRIIIDELESILREKVRTQMHDVRTKFRHAAELDSTGKISREALHHLIASIFGTQKQVGPKQIDQLLERIHLQNSTKISFDEFLQSLFTGEEDLPGWISRQSTTPNDYLAKRTASQMFIILKEKARTKNKDLLLLCPALDGGPSSRIFKAQFHNALIDMGYRMIEKEFDKLWDKFDTDGFHAVTSEKFLKRLINEEVSNPSPSIPTSETQDQQSSILKAPHMIPSQNESNVKTSRLNTARNQLDENQIRTWLNHKFPQGFSELENALERLDTKQTGILPRDRFVDELKHFGLILDGTLLDFFFKRLNIDLTLTGGWIPYRDVIQVFQEQVEPPNKRMTPQNTLPRKETRQSSLERQVEYLISINYDKIRDQLIRLDTYRMGLVNSNDLRSLIEDLLEFPLRPDEFYQLLKQFPLDENGKIKYNDYLKQVMERTNTQQQEQHQQKSPVIPQWDYMRSKNIRESLDQEHIRKKKSDKFREVYQTDQRKARPIEQLREIVKTIIRDRYKDLEDEFKKVDRGSYGELTQDLLYDLFHRLSIEPEISRSEIVLLWSRCHLKENGNLDFYQFLREFGYSKRSAHYPNAKQNPPKKGDADFLLTSRKLYGDSVLVHGTALNAIRSNWDQLRREFTQLDPYRTGFIQSEEFDEILIELCPPVNQEDLDMLKSRFQTTNDQRMNYVQFLKHHVPLAEFIEDIDQPNKLKRKLANSSKQFRRAFKEKDRTNCGSIPVQVFKEILIEQKCSLNEEELYTLISQLDTKMDGRINYHYFIQQYLTNI